MTLKEKNIQKTLSRVLELSAQKSSLQVEKSKIKTFILNNRNMIKTLECEEVLTVFMKSCNNEIIRQIEKKYHNQKKQQKE